MTVGELQKILEGIPDKNTPVVVSDEVRYGYVAINKTLQTSMGYLGDSRFSMYGKDGGEPETVLVIEYDSFYKSPPASQ